MARNYISPREAAERYGFHYGTVLGWIRSGELEAYRFKRQYRIPESAIDIFAIQAHPRSDWPQPPSPPADNRRKAQGRRKANG